MSRRSARESVQARADRQVDRESTDRVEPAPESPAESFSEEDIAEGAELLREVEQSDLPDEVKSSLSRFAEKAAGAAARLEEAEERAARQSAELEELRGLREAEKLVGSVGGSPSSPVWLCRLTKWCNSARFG